MRDDAFRRILKAKERVLLPSLRLYSPVTEVTYP